MEVETLPVRDGVAKQNPPGFGVARAHVVKEKCIVSGSAASNSVGMQLNRNIITKSGSNLKRAIRLAVLLLLLEGTSFAFGTGSNHVEVGIVSSVSSIEPGKPFLVAVRLDVSPGWHIYWKNPGNSGYPTSIDWKLPKGFVAGPIQWPYPEKFVFEGLVNYGYEGTTYLLVQITPSKNIVPGEVAKLEANVGWLVCKDVCMPGKGQATLNLIVKSGPAEPNTASSKIMAHASSLLPINDSGWKFDATVYKGVLQIKALKPDWYKGEMKSIAFFPDESSFFIQPDSSQVLSRIANGYVLSIPVDTSKYRSDTSVSGVLVSDTGWRGSGSERAVIFSSALTEGPRVLSEISAPPFRFGELFLMIVFAFVGGAILNLMPCVLPVLSLKIMGFVKQAGEERKRIFRHGAAFTIGVVISFWILAGLLLALRAGGQSLGWGFQLQSIGFVTVLSLFLFLFALNMFGVFEIGVSLSAVGQNVSGGSGYWGSFVSGVLATVVATPCTAPFMGSALGFALAQPAYWSILVFTFLGLGMAAPYLILTTSPALLRFVPKPGAWMETLKQFMGFLLMATVLWLLWVLSRQAGAQGVIVLLASLLIAGLGAWVYGRWGALYRTKLTRRVAQLIAAAAIAVGLLLALQGISPQASQPTADHTNGNGIEWQPYSPELISTLRKEHKPVFIDFTAAWCLSCQVNERVAFSSSEVRDAFKKKGIVPVKADWTNQSPVIARALADFGRESVPLYVLYPPDPDSRPVILPELITPGIVLSALDKIK